MSRKGAGIEGLFGDFSIKRQAELPGNFET